MEEVNSIQNSLDHLKELQSLSSKQFQDIIHLKASETDEKQRQLNEVITGLNATIQEMKHGIAYMQSSYNDVIASSKALKEKLSSSADKGVGRTIDQLISKCSKMIDMTTEYGERITQFINNENKWSNDWLAQRDLIFSTKNTGKKIECVREEIHRSEEQYLKDCNDFKTGNWRDDSAGTEPCVLIGIWKFFAKRELDKVNQLERNIRVQCLNGWRIPDPRAQDEYRSIMDERTKIVEECKEVLNHCVSTGVFFSRYGKYIDWLKKLETELRERSDGMMQRYFGENSIYPIRD